MVKHIVTFKLLGSNEDWDVVLTAIVKRMEDVAVYANHPAHVAAAGLLAGHKEARACVDYYFE